ncbi:hypothetical protein [Promicromonospora sp. NPDC090134]|uniref:hypothetical protein n=1 Tax=Promicromonospora sp. NPDC090134 TaxID=3364408 RepID=UPI0037F6B44F
MNRIRRTLAAVAGLTMLATVLTAAPASAWTRVAGHCVGDRVDRCVSIRQNSNGTVYVRGSVSDDSNRPGDYVVRIVETDITITRDWTNPPSITFFPVKRNFPYEDVSDALATPAFDMSCGTDVTGSAKLQWKPKSGGSVETGWVHVSATVC